MKSRRVLAGIVLLANLFLSGCWSSREVNTLGISVCLGIDKSDKGYVISEQVINPKTIASKKMTSESPVVVYTQEGEDINETITRMTTITSRKIYHSHLRMVILGEEIAREGISNIVDYLLRNPEFRTDFYFAIARGSSAREILSVLTPIELIPGVDMFTKLKMATEEWAPVRGLRIIELANDLTADGINATITAVEKVDDGDTTNSTDTLKKSGEFEKLKFTDIGVFKQDKLVGWLDELESKGYNYITDKVLHTVGFETYGDNGMVSYDIPKTASKIKAVVRNNQPAITVEVKLTYDIVDVKGDLNVSKVENIELINKLVEKKLRIICESAIHKAQKELGSDIFGFGERVHDADKAYWKTVKDKWNEVFVDIPVTLELSAKMNSTGDITKSITQKN
ncbi:spore germination protein KC [Sporobacter termitidis DSM 10068]|uniref:Spore germination protein KC n=1 Tax=Sporobacter termitidis DSM 10068 TaxID=1123282 RepID=A0A1M5VIF9_9FIRM|nr:Ger(x)C family spore germination protein [Sporobacter termitidis]SHH75036.1 spore germination protein KC [Sporobacter termitidis DSM 10068]